MGMEVVYRGVVTLKPDVEPATIIRAYLRHCGVEDDLDVELDDFGQWDEDGGLTFTFGAGLFEYDVDGHYTIHFPDEFGGFLLEVASTWAAEGWLSDEGPERDRITVAYGPDPLARAQAQVEAARSALEAAAEQFSRAKKQLEEVVR